MPDITISDAAMEAAAHAMFEVTGEPDWTAMEIRQVVEAAAPYIATQALRDAAGAFYGPDGPHEIGPAMWLRRRANRIEADHG